MNDLSDYQQEQVKKLIKRIVAAHNGEDFEVSSSYPLSIAYQFVQGEHVPGVGVVRIREGQESMEHYDGHIETARRAVYYIAPYAVSPFERSAR